MEDLMDRFTLGDSTWNTSGIPFKNKYRVPRGEGCLFVEIGTTFGPLLYTKVVDANTDTRGWNYLLCRKQGSQYTFILSEVVNALPSESPDVLMDPARRHIEDFTDFDAATVGPRISIWGVREVYLFARPMTNVWQPRDESFAKSLEDWKNVQLTAENLDKDLFSLVGVHELKQFKQPSVVVFSTSR